MEEGIALLLQFILEVGLQLFGGLGFDCATSREKEKEDGCGWLILFGILGAICGGLSLVFAPKPILPFPWLRIANLIVAPLFAGLMSYLVAGMMTTQKSNQTHHFWRGFWFAMLFGIVRFAFIHR